MVIIRFFRKYQIYWHNYRVITLAGINLYCLERSRGKQFAEEKLFILR